MSSDTSPAPIRIQAHKPVIHIYVRHSKDCVYQGDEGWKRCTCLKWIRWRENGRLRREPTKSRTWAGAERHKAKIETASDAAEHGQPIPSAPITVEQAIELFKTKKASKAKATLTKYRQTLGRLLDFCNEESRY